MAHRPSKGDHIRLLIAPPRDKDVLIADEVVYYKAPKHMMSLAQPFAETLAVLVLVTSFLTQPAYEGLTLGFLVFVLSGLVVWRWIKERDWGWSALGGAVVLAYVIATNDITPRILVPGVGLFFIGRLGLAIMRWWRYEVRYLTNRRIIEATGFLGLHVASMPVSRVTDLVLHRTASGELLGYGDLRIESAGQDQSLANIPYLVEPSTFHRLAVRLATKPAEIDLSDFIDVRPVRQIEKRA
ncbi:MAG: PH domain-containing protein [Acidimicrobiales bacterium]